MSTKVEKSSQTTHVAEMPPLEVVTEGIPPMEHVELPPPAKPPLPVAREGWGRMWAWALAGVLGLLLVVAGVFALTQYSSTQDPDLAVGPPVGSDVGEPASESAYSGLLEGFALPDISSVAIPAIPAIADVPMAPIPAISPMRAMAIPDMEIPDITIPDMTIPDMTIPSIEFPPFASIPSIEFPPVPSVPSIPSSSVPSIPAFPEISIPAFPQISVPAVPEISIPRFASVPSISVPSIPVFPEISIPPFPEISIPPFQEISIPAFQDM